jgi:hypothetical protein
MSIINKGVFDADTMTIRQTGSDWPTAQVIYTSDILENPANLYFTNARVAIAVVPQLTTANVTEISSNLYFTNTRAIQALTIGTVSGSISVTGNLVANGLIIRNIDVQDSALTGSTSANNIVADSVTSNVWGGLYTANVVETSGNLYFTQTRARQSFSAGNNITIEPNGTINALTQAVVSNDSETITAVADTLTYVLSRNITNPKSILVINEGLIQIPVTDYDTAGSTITFTTQPPVNSLIEIRYFGIDSAASFSSTFLATVNTFTGNGSNTIFPLTITPGGQAYTTTIIDGVMQQTGSYIIDGSTIVFTEAPVNGANIDVRIYSGSAGGSFNTRTFVGDGSTRTYQVTSGFNAQNILIFENGVAQVADVDYTVSANALVTFTTAPAANIVVQIREMGTGVANLVNQIAGIDIRTGNLVPLFDGSQTIGTANLRYNKIYLTESNSLILGNTTVSISGTTLTLSTAGSTTVVGASTRTPDIISPFMLMGA